MAHSERRQRMLRAAAHRGDLDLLRMLLVRGADPNIPAGNPTSRSDRTVLMRAVEAGHAECVRLLLAYGARPDAFTAAGDYTALALAIERGDPGLVRILLEGGAQLETPTRDGLTPLMRAVRRGGLEIVELLLHAGADPAAVTRWFDPGRSVRELARKALERRQQRVRSLAGYETREVTLALRHEREARAILRLLEDRLRVEPPQTPETG